MTPAHVVQITTPKKYILNGLWFGPKKPKTAIIFVHGLAGSVFGEVEKRLTKPFIDNGTPLLLFNNRGHDIISKLYGDAPNTRKGYKRIVAGSAHEVFTDCVDDIEGAVQFLEKTGAKQIILIGHSTGCQKSIYWASKKAAQHRKVRLIVLLAPASDRAAYIKEIGERKLKSAELAARSLVKQKKGADLMPKRVWPVDVDAQRLLSLSSATSSEEIFLYAQPTKRAATLQQVKTPILVVWPERDEFVEQPAQEIANWFEKTLKNKHRVIVVPKVGHSFKGGEKAVAKAIRAFMKES